MTLSFKKTKSLQKKESFVNRIYTCILPKKKSTLKGKTNALDESKFFLFRVEPFSEVKETGFIVVSPEIVSFPIKFVFWLLRLIYDRKIIAVRWEELSYLMRKKRIRTKLSFLSLIFSRFLTLWSSLIVLFSEFAMPFSLSEQQNALTKLRKPYVRLEHLPLRIAHCTFSYGVAQQCERKAINVSCNEKSNKEPKGSLLSLTNYLISEFPIIAEQEANKYIP